MSCQKNVTLCFVFASLLQEKVEKRFSDLAKKKYFQLVKNNHTHSQDKSIKSAVYFYLNTKNWNNY
jgi:hypothetical protein